MFSLMERILVSSCLLGQPVRYDGGGKRRDDPLFDRWRAEGRLVPCCPEVAGGLPVPRPAAELAGRFVIAENGADVTSAFVEGARLALEVARRHGLRIAILKDGSPSCGSSRIYDGSFTGRSVPGRGVTAELLVRSGIAVFAEDELDAVQVHLSLLEGE
jgi:uncharacterized protein YbbK (DUF523 family)